MASSLKTKKAKSTTAGNFPVLSFPEIIQAYSNFGGFSPFGAYNGFGNGYCANNANCNISEDAKYFYLETPVPGCNPTDIKVSVNDGCVWINCSPCTTGNTKSKSAYQAGPQNFCWSFILPHHIDSAKAPTATCKNGLLTLTFCKTHQGTPKTVPVKGVTIGTSRPISKRNATSTRRTSARRTTAARRSPARKAR